MSEPIEYPGSSDIQRLEDRQHRLREDIYSDSLSRLQAENQRLRELLRVWIDEGYNPDSILWQETKKVVEDQGGE